MDYDELVKSNWGFLSNENQAKISQSRVLLAGCGLGSNIALLAARTGFTRFILADGDNVEIGNLNRQAFRREHLGRNKAEITAALVREVNPQAFIRVFPHFIKEEAEVADLVNGADLVANMVDPGPVLFHLNHIARIQDKPVVFPLNIGFGGAVLAFTRDSATIEEMTALDSAKAPEQFFLQLVEKISPLLPEYIQGHLDIKDRIVEEHAAIPQLGIAANISAALVVTAMIKLTLGVPLEVAPQPLTLDCWQP